MLVPLLLWARLAPSTMTSLSSEDAPGRLENVATGLKPERRPGAATAGVGAYHPPTEVRFHAFEPL